jgi:hypothetical protein
MRHRVVLLAALLLLGCSADRDPGSLFGPTESGTPVVDALLLVDQPLPPVYLRRTGAPGLPYSREAAAIVDARVRLLQGEQVYAYVADPDSAGRYLPPPGAPAVRPLTEYRLEVDLPGGPVRGRALTPDRIRVEGLDLLDERGLQVERRLTGFRDLGQDVYSAPENQLTYLDGLLQVRFGPAGAPAYQLALFSLDPDSPFLVDASFIEPEDAADFDRQGSSPPFAYNGGTAYLPWLAVAYGGRHLIKVFAVDQNWFDYARSSPEENSGPAFGGLVGDAFDRPYFRLEGGIGLFGAAAVDSAGFYVLPRTRERPACRQGARGGPGTTSPGGESPRRATAGGRGAAARATYVTGARA